jgi:restriction system protein
MAKSRGLLADLQRELARRQRVEQQRVRMQAQAAARAKREHEQAMRKAAQDAAATEKERRRLYVEERKAEAASRAASLQARISELDSVLTSGICQRPLVTFSSLKGPVTYPAFDAGGLDRALPAPGWEQFAPLPPSGLGKVFGGGARRERQEAAACAACDEAAGAAVSAAQAHNEGVDQFEQDFLGREPEARYARLIAQVAIRAIHEILVSVPADVATAVTFYGHVSTTDQASVSRKSALSH